jgi:phosphoglycerate kinase
VDKNTLPIISQLINLKGKKVLLRVDLNLPMIDGKISDDTRLLRVMPTIKFLLEKGAVVILLSHFGRPKNVYDPSLSLAPIADVISSHLKQKVYFGVDVIGLEVANKVASLKAGEIILLENLRFHKQEEANDKNFAKEIAGLGDIYVNEAFSCSHRKHASIYALAELLPSYAGFSFANEIKYLEILTKNPHKPFAGIVGGAKVSSKIEVLYSLLDKVDALFIGGGMANTFLFALGYQIGKSLCEKDFCQTALNIIKEAKNNHCEIILPSDVVVAKEFKADVACQNININNIAVDDLIEYLSKKS